MKASKFSDPQKAFILKEGADGIPVRRFAVVWDQAGDLDTSNYRLFRRLRIATSAATA